jgi:very-short-patch-repair endonuclease
MVGMMAPKKHIQTSEQSAQARQLRRDSTFPERLLWSGLRGNRLCGLKFRRQYPVGPYCVDFFCHQASLIVELDGMSHVERTEQDRERTAYLAQRGLHVMRVTNDDVLDDLEAVVRGIALACGVDPDKVPSGHSRKDSA